MKKHSVIKTLGALMGLGAITLLFNPAQAGSTLSAGYRHVCGVKTDGNLSCWGDNTHNQTQAPDGQFTQIGAGYWFNCGLRTDGSVTCWGEDAYGQTSPPPGQFIQVDAGGHHACALYADGNAVCWGKNDTGQSSPPPGPFKQLALGSDHSCGLTLNGTVSCWGSNSDEQSKDVADMTYITAGYKTTCGVKNDGTANCWGLVNGSYGYLNPIDFSLHHGHSSTRSELESFLFCGLKSDYSLSCPSSTAAPTGRFTYVTVGADGHYFDPPGSYNDGDYRHSFACGIRENGLVACWGENYNDRATAPVNVTFKQPFQLPQPETTATIGTDMSLQLHRMNYHPMDGGVQVLWGNFRFLGANERGRLTWELADFGVVH